MNKEQPNFNWCQTLAITTVALALVGCSSVPKKTLSGEAIKPIPEFIEVPSGVVLVVAVCIPDKKVIIDNNNGIRYSKIYKKSFSTKRLKLGYPQKVNDSYWLTNILGENGKIYGFVLPNDLDNGQRLAHLWNLRDLKVNHKWSGWLKPDYKIDDISDYSKNEWGLIGQQAFDQLESPLFLAKFRLFSYREYMLEQVNQWDLNPMEPCIATPKIPLLITKEEKKIQKEKLKNQQELNKNNLIGENKILSNLKSQADLKINSDEGLELNRSSHQEFKASEGNNLSDTTKDIESINQPSQEAMKSNNNPSTVYPSIKLPPRRILEPTVSVE